MNLYQLDKLCELIEEFLYWNKCDGKDAKTELLHLCPMFKEKIYEEMIDSLLSLAEIRYKNTIELRENIINFCQHKLKNEKLSRSELKMILYEINPDFNKKWIDNIVDNI